MTDKISYEEASKELQDIIDKIENSSLPLDESMKLFERGELLIKQCYSCLDGAKGKFYELKESLEGLDEV